MESAGLPRSARAWLEEQGYTDGSIEELRDIGNDEVNALLQHVQNSGESSEVDRVRAALCGVRFVHSGQLMSSGCSCFGGGKLKWSCCQSGDVDVMWCSEEQAKEKAAREKAAREKAAREEKAAKMKAKFKIGQSVTWMKSDSDVPEGTVGSIKSWENDGLSASVTFYSGCWNFKFEQLRISSRQPTVRF